MTSDHFDPALLTIPEKRRFLAIVVHAVACDEVERATVAAYQAEDELIAAIEKLDAARAALNEACEVAEEASRRLARLQALRVHVASQGENGR